MDNRPIGVFDSGLGGLTVVKQLRELLPNEEIVYFGDTGRVPYGGRSEQTLMKYVLQDIGFLQTFNIKMIIAACGTASAVVLPKIQNTFAIPVFGVLQQAAKDAVANTKNGKVGIIATAATVKSKAYENVIGQIDARVFVVSKACPLFVPLVENGHLDTEVAHLVAQAYLEPLKQADVDTVIMGCTHYPLLKKTLTDVLGTGVRLIDVGEAVARYIRQYLQEKQMETDSRTAGVCHYYVSDDVDNFEAIGGLFLQSKIEGLVNKIDIDKYECTCSHPF